MRKKAAATCSIGVDSDRRVLDQFPKDARPGVILVCDDAISFIRSRESWKETFIYCDPPYLMSVRSSKKNIYLHEFSTEEKHLELLSLLKALPAAVMISGYWSQTYEDQLGGWSTITINTVKRSGSRATEWLWMNYLPPIILHDYSFLGKTFRERERIKRRQHRWRSRLEKMNHLERAALLMAIEDPGTTTPNLALRSATSNLALVDPPDPIVKKEGPTRW